MQWGIKNSLKDRGKCQKCETVWKNIFSKMRWSKAIQSDHFTCKCVPPPFHIIFSDLSILNLVHFPLSFQQVGDLVMIPSTVVFRSVVFSIQLLTLSFKQTLWNLTRNKMLWSRTFLPLLFWEERGGHRHTYVWRHTYGIHIASKGRVCETFTLIWLFVFHVTSLDTRRLLFCKENRALSLIRTST